MTSSNNISDSELLSQMANDNRLAYAEIYNRYKGVLFLHAFKIIKDEDEAKDIIQELFITLWLRRKGISITTNLSAYLYTAIRNRVLDHIAHKSVQGKYIDSLACFIEQGEWVTDQQIREKELSELIELEIAQLPPKMRQVFQLSRFEEYSHFEIAQKLNISDKTVKKQVHNALQILRKKLELTVFIWFL